MAPIRCGVAIAGITACISAGCERSPGAAGLRPAQARGASVLLVTIDTLRQDRVGAYASNNLTPALDRLAASGVRFAHAYAQAPMTLPSHAAILTGLTPPHSAVRNNTNFRLGDRTPTLATELKRAGYRTGAFVGAFVLDARFGLSRGFDVYDDHLPVGDATSFHVAERRAPEVLQAAEAWIGQTHAGPYFAWVHLFDPHAPYAAPAEFRAGRSAYDAEVAYTDAQLGQFLDRLRAAHHLDNTVVVVTADHGEALGEHGEATHGLFAYQSTLAVPLIVAMPGGSAAIVRTPAALVDIAPTVLDVVDAPVPANLDGVSQAREVRADRPIYFEALDAWLTRGWAPLTGVIQNGWKYIDLPEPELYDLASDPAETKNRAADEGRRRALAAALAAATRTTAASEPAVIDADAAARLRSLGYASGRSTAPSKPTVRDDPKRLVALNERFTAALTAFEEGRGGEALDGFAEVLRSRPDFLTARTSAAAVLVAQRRAADAVRLLRDAPPELQRSPELQQKLAAAQREAGDFNGAIATLESIRASAPEVLDVAQDLAVAYAAAGRIDQARQAFAEVLRDPRAPATAWYNFGLLELQASRRQQAADAFAQAVARAPAYGRAWHALGATLLETDRARAVDAWRRAERLLPGDYDLLFNLGMVLSDRRDPEARPYLERFVRDAPPAKYARDIESVKQRLRSLDAGGHK